MKTLNLVQGSPEWLAARKNYRTASEASAMMGQSKYMTRSELLSIKATGIAPEVSATTQRLFDRGHESEAGARAMAEQIIGEELFPATVTDDTDYLLASLDGMTMLGDVIWEHKLWNADLAADVAAGRCPSCHFWQVIQALVVTGAEKCLFMVSDGTPDNCAHVWVTLEKTSADKLMAGWKQFDVDLAGYQHTDSKAAPVAAPVETLPAIVYTIDRGTLALTSNLPAFREAATALVDRTKAPLVTDQDFADREALCKAFGEAEKLLKMKAEEVVGQIHDVATFSRELGDIAEMFRTARLASEKLVEAEKKNRRAAIVQKGEQALRVHIDSLNARLARVRLPAYAADFAGAIKGKKSLTSIQDAVDTKLAQAKVETSAMADEMQVNLAALDELAADHGFLFADLQQVVTKAADDFRALVQLRIAQHRAKEEARLEAERERIRQEEAAKLERERQRAEAAERARQAEEARVADEARLEQQRADLAKEQEALRAALAAEQARARQQDPLTPTAAALDDIASKLDLPDGVEWPDFKPAATTAQDDEDTSALPAERTYTRPSDEELIMAVAERFLVPEHIAYEWLAGFGAQKKAA